MSKRDSDTTTNRPAGARPVPAIREAHDAMDHQILKLDPSDDDARLDIALDESFPTSDAPGHSRPGSSEPAPSSGFDEKIESAITRKRKRKAVASSIARIAAPLAVGGALIVGAGVWLFARTKQAPEDEYNASGPLETAYGSEGADAIGAERNGPTRAPDAGGGAYAIP